MCIAALPSLAVSGWSGMPGQPDDNITYFINAAEERERQGVGGEGSVVSRTR